mmetsp:Transcript_63692/g.175852  ORF Transcript_63692/g.175852 Transcript_63692/m.175852 type:complete len:225 (+) Transcript_63692:2191-2865(+)
MSSTDWGLSRGFGWRIQRKRLQITNRLKPETLSVSKAPSSLAIASESALASHDQSICFWDFVERLSRSSVSKSGACDKRRYMSTPRLHTSNVGWAVRGSTLVVEPTASDMADASVRNEYMPCAPPFSIRATDSGGQKAVDRALRPIGDPICTEASRLINAHLPCIVRITFEGFKSPWMRPSSCRWPAALPSATKIFEMAASSSRSCSITVVRLRSAAGMAMPYR